MRHLLTSLFALSALALSAQTPEPIVRTFTVNGVSFDMIAVRGGTFWRGAQSVDPDFINYDPQASENEMPMRRYELSDFWISRYPITQDLWYAVMGMSPNNDVYIDDVEGKPYYQVWSNYPSTVGDRFPAYYLSYIDLQKFYAKLGELMGYAYTFDFPTEAQWEYAARGGEYIDKEHDYIYAGSNDYNEVAWVSENADEQNHEVGLLKPNALGLYDMCGSVAEWCKDSYTNQIPESKYADYYYSTGNTMAMRGGRFARPAVHNRIAKRYDAPKDQRQAYFGGRIVIRRGLAIPEEPTGPSTAVESTQMPQMTAVTDNNAGVLRIKGAEAEVQIIDMSGATCLRCATVDGSVTISISSLPKGIYVVRSGASVVRCLINK